MPKNSRFDLLVRESDIEKVDVALVSMPWAAPTEPSLGLSILKACLRKEGIHSRVFHMAPTLLRWCTIETYTFLADMIGVNEFLFTGMVDSGFDEAQQQMLNQCASLYAKAAEKYSSRYNHAESIFNLVLEMRNRIVPEFIEYTIHRVLASQPKLVGLTCLFDQTMASVALAKRLKEVAPELPIILGGYSLHGAPGYTVRKVFPWVDLIVTGDGEHAIVDLALDVLACKPITLRANTPGKTLATSPVTLDQSPIPDYADWFLDLDNLATIDKVQITTEALPVESSRGCWWGQKQHCIFCGNDNETLKFRHKSPSMTLLMLAEMYNRYGDHVFRFSDYIMPKDYYATVLPALADQDRKYRLHAEVKANHPPDRIRLLSEAGFREIQPGIESFSTPVLKEIRKGVRAIDNVSVLKAGYLYGVVVHYNILFGFPGDTVAAYREMLRNVPQLYHLVPPVSCSEALITRFAPLHSDRERFGIDKPNVHHKYYDLLFSMDFLARSGLSLDSYVYYFERGFEFSEDLKILYSQLRQQVTQWKVLHRERFAELSYGVFDGQVAIVDSRYRQEYRYSLSAEGSAVYLACDTRPTKLGRIQSELESAGGGISRSVFTDAIDELVARRLIWVEDDFIFGLAVPHTISAERERSGWRKRWVSPWI